MYEEENKDKKNIVIISIIVSLIVIGIITIFLLIFMRISSDRIEDDKVEPIPTTFPLEIRKGTFPYTLTRIGETTKDEVRRLPNVKEEVNIDSEKTQFNLSTSRPLYDAEVITKNDVVVFEKSIAITQNLTHPKLSSFKQTYGEPEHIINGSVRYGNFAQTLIYASKGFALVINQFTEEVFEVHRFYPTNVEGYLSSWASDITEYKEPEGHHDN